MEQTVKELDELSRWYRKWAIRYSLVYSIAAVSALVAPSVFLAKSMMGMMTLIAVASSIHLWPAFRASLVFRGKMIRSRIGVYGKVIGWVAMGTLMIFTEPSVGNFRGPIAIFFFIGFPMVMWEAYINQIERGE